MRIGVKMGESSRRKLADPLYGKKTKGFRGIMMVPMFYADDDINEMKTHSFLSIEQVRFGLLFWDKIAWPALPFVPRNDGEFSILNESGILLRPSVNIQPTSLSAGKSLAVAYFNAYLDLDRSNPGRWCLSAESESDIRSFVKNDILLDRGISVSLHRAIPIPSKDAPLEDILEFKLKRESELIELRFQINELAQMAASSNDKREAIANQVDRIDSACTNLLRVTKEKKLPIRLSDISFTSEIAPGSIIAAGIAINEINLPSVGGFVSSIGLAALAGLKLTKSFSYKNNLVRKSPFKYVYHLHEEIDWQ